MKDGYAQNIESKLKALELAFELDSKIKQIEENLKSKEVERNRQIAEMKQFLEARGQSFNSQIQSSAQSLQKPIGESSKDRKDVNKPDD